MPVMPVMLEQANSTQPRTQVQKVKTCIKKLIKDNLFNYRIIDVLNNPKYTVDVLAEIALTHYQKYDIQYWKTFISTYAPLCSNIFILEATKSKNIFLFKAGNIKENVLICGMAMVIRQKLDKNKNELYLRLLCSLYGCGKLLLDHVESYAVLPKDVRFSLHTEPYAIGFYKKNGYSITNQYYAPHNIPFFSLRYPLLVKPCNEYPKMVLKKEEKIIQKAFMGLYYYFHKYT